MYVLYGEMGVVLGKRGIMVTYGIADRASGSGFTTTVTMGVGEGCMALGGTGWGIF